MTEKSAEERLSSRITELNSKSKLALQRLGKALLLHSELDAETSETVSQIISANEYSAATGNDELWLAGLMGAGIPDEIIIRVWNIKEALSLAIKDTAQDIKD